MPIDLRPLAIFLMGPTATGKTELACALSSRFPLDLISVDSALVYRGMDVGTAKPDAATLARCPHALVDIRDPAETYSAADFRADALALMQAGSRHGRVPLLVGGTGLYFRALQQGLSNLPSADRSIRDRLGLEAAQRGWPALHARLAEQDPDAARRIDGHDAQRIQRALEVIEITGRRLSDLHQDQVRRPFPWRVLKLGLLPTERGMLHARIAERLEGMLAAGLVQETEHLLVQPGVHAGLPAMRAVGYRQAAEFLRGECTASMFRERAIYATRQLAKRQVTWLRGDPALWHLEPWHAGLQDQATTAVATFLGARRR